MTVLTAKNLLFEWFLERNDFTLINQDSKTRKKVDSIDELTKNKKIIERFGEISFAAVKVALSEFEKDGITSCVDDGLGEKIYVLNKNFNLFDQNVQISPRTCLALAKTLNTINDYTGNKLEICDPTKISEIHIEQGVFIINGLLEEIQLLRSKIKGNEISENVLNKLKDEEDNDDDDDGFALGGDDGDDEPDDDDSTNSNDGKISL